MIFSLKLGRFDSWHSRSTVETKDGFLSLADNPNATATGSFPSPPFLKWSPLELCHESSPSRQAKLREAEARSIQWWMLPRIRMHLVSCMEMKPPTLDKARPSQMSTAFIQCTEEANTYSNTARLDSKNRGITK